MTAAPDRDPTRTARTAAAPASPTGPGSPPRRTAPGSPSTCTEQASRRSCSSPRRRSSTRASGKARSPSSAATSASWLRRPRQRALGPPADPEAYIDDRVVDDAAAVLDASGTRPPCSWACAATACGDPSCRGRSPERVAGIVAFAPAFRSSPPPYPWRVAVLVQGRAADGRGMGEAQPPLLAPGLPGVHPLLLRERSGASRTRQRSSTTWSSGRRSTARWRRCSPTWMPHRTATGRPSSRRPRGALPDAAGPRHRGPLPAAVALASAGGAHRRAARRCRGRRPPDPGPAPGARQPADPRLRPKILGEACAMTAPVDDLDPFLEPQAEGAVHLVPHRPRARPAGRGDRRRAAQAAPGRPDRLARPAPRHGGPRGPRREDPPAQRGARQRIRPHHCGVVRARPQRVPGDPAHGRDPRREFHGVPRRDRERRVRPRDRRRGLGRRLLPPREPGAQADGVRVDDRLRRLAADAVRRRSRGVPDVRLQRRDDRAGRALPADPRPGDLRRRTRRHRARRLRAGPAGRSATGPSATTSSAAT